MDQELLKLVRCPVTKSPLGFADAATIETLNRKITRGTLYNRIGQLIETAIESGLVNEDQSLLLPIRNGITIMVADQAIPLADHEID